VTGPTLWWRGVCDDSKLAKAVVSVLSRPPTSAATERVSLHTAGIYIKFNGETEKYKCKSNVTM
jgi:hypothetical protein